MPYINKGLRAMLDGGAIPTNAGELNYLISMRIKREYTEKGKSYALFNSIIADLTDVMLGIKMGVRLEPGFGGDVSDLAVKFVMQSNDLATAKVTASAEEMALRLTDAAGAVECAKLEFYRRVVAPHEDEKMKDNGDVY